VAEFLEAGVGPTLTRVGVHDRRVANEVRRPIAVRELHRHIVGQHASAAHEHFGAVIEAESFSHEGRGRYGGAFQDFLPRDSALSLDLRLEGAATRPSQILGEPYRPLPV